MKSLLSLLFLIFVSHTWSQYNVTKSIQFTVDQKYDRQTPQQIKKYTEQIKKKDERKDEVYEVIDFPDIDPYFSKGNNELFSLISTKLKAPKKLAKNKLYGTIEVKFIVDGKGVISNYNVIHSDFPKWNKVIKRSITSEKWNPGSTDGKNDTFECGLQFNFKDRSAVLLVPYNDNGKWTWSDTLAQITDKIRLKSVTPFYPIENGKEYVATVTTDVGQNKYYYGKGLAVPEDVSISYQLYDFNRIFGKKRDYLQVKDANKQFGIYQVSEKKYFLDPIYDDISVVSNGSQYVILTKKSEDENYERYFVEDNRFEKTNIVEVLIVGTNRGNQTVGKHPDGTYSIIEEGSITPFPNWESYNNDQQDNRTYVEAPSFHSESAPSIIPSYKSQKDGVVQTVNYSRNSDWILKKYGFSKLILERKNGKLGVTADSGAEILPFEYDKLVFAESNSMIYLKKNGKYGCKIIFTHYPLIEAKYESIKYSRQIKVSNNWNFGLFSITHGDQRGFVGENGVEYFDFSKLEKK